MLSMLEFSVPHVSNVFDELYKEGVGGGQPQKHIHWNKTRRYNCWNLAGSPILTQELPQNKPCVLTLSVLMCISVVLGKCVWINW